MSASPLLSLAPRWRFLDSGAADGATNMATDAALMAQARRTGIATLRVYAWDRPTVSFGRHERTRDRFDPARIAARGIGVVRRPTGGRALLHHREVTYSVTAPANAMSLGESYAAINALLLDALVRLGVIADVAAAVRRPLRPEGAACFAEPAAGELTVDGRKLVGSAQLREEGALLQHGSILIADDQDVIADLRTTGTISLPATASAATLGAILGREISYGEVCDALASALGAAVGSAVGSALGSALGSAAAAARAPSVPLEPPPATASLQDDLARLVIAFAQPSWTWRR